MILLHRQGHIMKIVTAGQMRRIDQVTIQERGIPGPVLMDRAGRAVAREAMECFEPEAVAIVTGKGNNAGDGFIVAGALLRHGIRTTVINLVSPEDLSGDALDAWEKIPHNVERVDQPDQQKFRELLSRHDLVIDAIFGTGLKSRVSEPWLQYIQTINSSRRPVLSVDIPSGLPGNGFDETTADSGPCVQADMTVTIGLPKIGMVMTPGVHSTGRVIVDDIGFPDDLLNDDAITTNLLTLGEAAGLLPSRNPDGHKGTFGRAMILGGSVGMTGAAVLSSLAAARSGAGLVYSAYPAPLGVIMESHMVEPVKIPLESGDPWFGDDQSKSALDAAAGMDAVAIGPGLGTRDETGRFLLDIIKGVKSPLVIDADGLNLLADDPSVLESRLGPVILTPHTGEAARLLGCAVEEVEKDRLEAGRALCVSDQCVVILKGAQTIITTPDGQSYLNPTGNSGLAKGGSGDVLTGLAVGLLAQGLDCSSAARLAVFLHGLAADIAAEETGRRAMLPSDVIGALGEGFMKLENAVVTSTEV
jgi:hydroxyethylthiazole kinase-like uncharacterized protein yjeF